MYWNGSIDLGTWDDDAEYVIFDDFEWRYLPFKKQFIGCQKEFTITDKYRRKRTIKWGKPSIVISNDDNDPWKEMSFSDKEWYSANSIRVTIDNPLFE